MTKQNLQSQWAIINPDSLKRKKGDKFWNKPHITNGGHNMKTGFHTQEVLNRNKNGELKSGWVWNVKHQKYVRIQKHD